MHVAWCSNTKRIPTVSLMIATSLEDTPSPCGDRRLKNRASAKRCTKGLQQKRHQCRAVKLLLCWGQMAQGRDGERRQRETLLQLDRPQEGKSEERKWSRNGLGLPAREAAREPLTALQLLAAARAPQGFPRGPGERVPCGWLKSQHRRRWKQVCYQTWSSQGHVLSSLLSPENTMREHARVEK